MASAAYPIKSNEVANWKDSVEYDPNKEGNVTLKRLLKPKTQTYAWFIVTIKDLEAGDKLYWDHAAWQIIQKMKKDQK